MDWVHMVGEEDYLMRPVLEGLCRYESLKDSSLDMEDLARMHAALDVKVENERRYRKAKEE